MISIGVLGVNHKTAGLALREEIAYNASGLADHLFSPFPMVLLSTCNRVEIYFHCEDLTEGHRYLLTHFRKKMRGSFEQAFYSFFGLDCFFHLCKVTAGLDSVIIAESEIQRQIKVAYANAKNLPSCLHFAFQKALKVGKEIRSKEHKQEGPTLYNALWRLAEWHDQKILLVGFSQINRGLISFLIHKGISNITLCSRYPEKINIEGIRIGNRDLLNKWQEFDVVISATQVTEYLIRGSLKKSCTIFDLSVPRSVDPNVGAKIYNIEEVNGWIKNHRNSDEPIHCESVIWQHVIRLSRSYANRASTGTVIKMTRGNSHPL